MKSKIFGLFVLACFFFACNKQSKQSTEFVGEYSFKENGLPNYIVEKINEGYTLKYKTTNQEWSEPKQLVPVDKETINKIFGKKSVSVISAYVWKTKQNQGIYIFCVNQDDDIDLFSSGFIYRREFDRANITEKLFKL